MGQRHWLQRLYRHFDSPSYITKGNFFSY